MKYHTLCIDEVTLQAVNKIKLNNKCCFRLGYPIDVLKNMIFVMQAVLN